MKESTHTAIWDKSSICQLRFNHLVQQQTFWQEVHSLSQMILKCLRMKVRVAMGCRKCSMSPAKRDIKCIIKSYDVHPLFGTQLLALIIG